MTKNFISKFVSFFAGVVDTADKHSFANISTNFRKKFEMVLMVYSGARGTLIYEKNLMSKISCQTPFKRKFPDLLNREVGDYPTQQVEEFSFKHAIADSPTQQVGESTTTQLNKSGSRFLIPNICATSTPQSERLERKCKGPMTNRLCKNLKKPIHCHSPLKWEILGGNFCKNHLNCNSSL